MTHFLQILQDVGSVPPGCLLVSLDVTGLYTNIPNQEDLLAAKNGLDQPRPDGKCLTNDSILHLLQQGLRKNNLIFCGKITYKWEAQLWAPQWLRIMPSTL